MNTHEIYIPIDISSPIQSKITGNISKYNDVTPLLYFQLFDKGHPMMLTDTTTISIAFTDNRDKSISGSGNLQIVNPYRGTISYEMSKNDIIVNGLLTVTLGINMNGSFFTIQTTLMVQDISANLYAALTNNTSFSNDTNSCLGNCTDCSNCPNCVFPCKYFSIYCRSCRRCKFAWSHNLYKKPTPFEFIKVCKGITPTPQYKPLPNYEDDENYMLVSYPIEMTNEGLLQITINDTKYICDVGVHGNLYLEDKSQSIPDVLIGLYLGAYNKLYYNKNEMKSW